MKNYIFSTVNEDHIINKTNQNPLDETKQKSFNQNLPVTFTDYATYEEKKTKLLVWCLFFLVFSSIFVLIIPPAR